MASFKDILTGNLSKKTVLTKLIPAIIAVMFACLFLANLWYPGPYDFRYLVVSSLQSRDDNPVGWVFTAIGFLIVAIMMIPMVGYFFRKLSKICKGTSGLASTFFIIGIIGAASLGLLDPFWHPMEKFHEMLGILALLGLWLTMMIYACPVLKDQTYKGGNKQFNTRIYTAYLFLIWVPLAGVVCSFLGMELLDYSWPDLDWIAQDNLVILSFALWEWILLVSIMVNFVLFTWLVPEEVIKFERQGKKEKIGKVKETSQ